MVLKLLLRFFTVAACTRLATSIRLDTLEEDGSEREAQREALTVFEQVVEVGAKIVEEMTCEDLRARMAEAVVAAKEAVSAALLSPGESKETEVAQSSQLILAFATEADKRKCLPDVMTGPGTQDGIKALLDDHLSAALMEQDRPEQWCHTGIPDAPLGDHVQQKSEVCCAAGCGLCAQEGNRPSIGDNVTVIHPTRHTGETGILEQMRDGTGGDPFYVADMMGWFGYGDITWAGKFDCSNRTGGEQQCCPEAIKNGAGYEEGPFCQSRSETGCRIPEETDPARDLHDAYGLLLAWQHGTADLGDPGQMQRDLLFPEDVERAENCPSPCGKCTRSHNSWRKGEEPFEFKCLLHKGEPAPSDARLVCTPPRRRRSFWRPHSWGRKSWCSVPDWKVSICQRLRVSALMSCGIRQIMGPLTRSSDRAIDFHYLRDYRTCVDDTISDLDGFDGLSPEVMAEVPRPNRVAFNLIVTLGLANGLAAFRDLSKPTPANVSPALLETFLQGRIVDERHKSHFNGTLANFVFGEFGNVDGCPSGFSVIDSPSQCQEAAEQSGYTFVTTDSWSGNVPKCMGQPSTARVWFNTHPNPGGTSSSIGQFCVAETGSGRSIYTPRCDTTRLEFCVPAWKRKMTDAWVGTWNTFIYTTFFGFWGMFWGGITFLFNAGALAAIGLLLGGPLLPPALYTLHMVGWTTVGTILGGLSGVAFQCFCLGHGCQIGSSWPCNQFASRECPNRDAGPRFGQSWTEFLEEFTNRQHGAPGALLQG